MSAIDVIPGQRQILKVSAGTLSAVWFSDGVVANPGVVTVGISASDGTVLLAAGTASDGTGAAARSVAFTTTHTANLDLLSVTWTSASYGEFAVTVEVVGAWLFTIKEAQEFDNLAVLNARPTVTVAAIEEARARILDEFELLTGVAWVPRYRSDIYNGPGCAELFLRTGRVRAVRGVEERSSGAATWTAFTQADLDDLYSETWGLLRRESLGTWTRGQRNWRIGYEHGYDAPPLDIKRAALLAARYELIPHALTDRAMSIFTEMGSAQIWTPGVSGRGQARHELPYVDRVLSAHDERVPVIA